MTIGIPTFNGASRYLEETLECALQQSYPNVEVLIADNCSTDHTEELVRCLTDGRLSYFRHPHNIGSNNNFNYCLEKANGSYFLLLHDDDLVDHDFVEVCMAAASEHGDVGIIRTGLRLIDGQGRIVAENANRVAGLSTEDFFLAWFEGRTLPFLCNTLFNTARLREIGGFRSKHNVFQDVIAEMRLAAQFGRVDVEAIKASARRHTGQRTFSTKVVEWCGDSLELLELLCNSASCQQQSIRSQGMRFFAQLNYRRTALVRPLWKRIRLYLIVYKSFGYAYSPITFLVQTKRHALNRRIRALARLVARGVK